MGQAMASSGTASVIMATEAAVILRSAAAASGLRSPSRVAASGAGTVTTTASASIAVPALERDHRRRRADLAARSRDRGVELLDEDAQTAPRSEERAGRRPAGGA